MPKKKTKKGFALLYAILLSGAVLSVGLILMNIITKQLLFSSLNRESEVTYYYLANSGRECLSRAAFSGKFIYRTFGPSGGFYVQPGSVEISCFGDYVILDKVAGEDKFASEYTFPDGEKVYLEVSVNETCLNNPSACQTESSNIEERYKYVAIATGYSGSTNPSRVVRRSAVYVQK
ncbi:MAG: hypothetical protein COV08_00205 [Candidatus Vogelbacteria bacterium CG10_big_fil_rev_8_21_14_0_10_49_38]|uniref:Type 4 fimbrial biogenesis protein PilX N-terminal domain-containing protein n=1 Tax=Candidatus Vogelbacteria bacterium CG10_big_fil_rev_8_21_14_0_10_49_38 TaxID=1975043 RepID=A0A2H0RK11_9BACT|nr:MAG: hypothetical protein BK006_00205 [bacterium CG10_49_38]PIR46344.1 MAG: hypothetical protein COV08_00205 [Candidatus Vogelbacteria bacterium CG10_big_fil_rev_8_21_14_0_10_49_38]